MTVLPLTSSQVIITCLTFGANLNYLMMADYLAADYSSEELFNSDEEESVKRATPKRKLLYPSRPSTVPKHAKVSHNKKTRMASSRLILENEGGARSGYEASSQHLGVLHRGTVSGSGRQKSAAQSKYKQRHCESVPELLGMKDSINPTNAKKQDEQNQHESTLGMEPPLVQPSSDELLDLVQSQEPNKGRISQSIPSQSKEVTSNETSSNIDLANVVPQWYNELILIHLPPRILLLGLTIKNRVTRREPL